MASLPSYAKILFDSYSRKKESALIRTEMESGPPKQAKFQSKVMITRNVKIYFASKADFINFETWYDTTLDQGSGWFDYVDEISGITVSARFVNGGYESSPLSAKMDKWQISAKIESWN